MSFHYYFDDAITIESVNNLVSLIQDKGEIDLWFQTEGGNTEAMEYLVSVFNSFGENIKITLNGALMSAGTKILTDYTGRLRIHEDIECFLFHKWDREMYNLREQVVKTDKLIRQTESKNIEFAKKLKDKGILNKKQIKKYMKGKDVIMYRKEILKLNL